MSFWMHMIPRPFGWIIRLSSTLLNHLTTLVSTCYPFLRCSKTNTNECCLVIWIHDIQSICQVCQVMPFSSEVLSSLTLGNPQFMIYNLILFSATIYQIFASYPRLNLTAECWKSTILLSITFQKEYASSPILAEPLIIRVCI